MAVFLTVLKVLLWIILILLGIVLLLILLILFCPIRYRLKGEMYDERIEASAKVRFFIISVIINFSKASGLDYAGKVLGIKVYPKKSKTKKSKKNIKKKSESKTDEISSDDQLTESDFEDTVISMPSPNIGSEIDSKTESKKETQTDSKSEPKKETKPDSKNDVKNTSTATLKKSSKHEESSSSSPKHIDSEELDQILEQQNESSIYNDSIPAESQSGQGKLTQIKDKIGTAAGKASEKAVSVKNGVESKIEKLETKVDHFLQFLDKPFTQRTIKRCKKLIVRVLKTVKPKKSRADITLGLSNAADTGTMIGRIYQFYPYFYKWLSLQGNYFEQGVEGEFDIRGRITLAFIIFPALRILLSRDFKRTRNLAKKI